jgi:UDP-N-acetylglucosamine 2-epimerase (non-hydrolysing)
MKVFSVVGARPNFIKIDPVLRALERRPEHFSTYLVHTGQHYDDRMSRVFFEELGIRPPDVHLGVGSGTHAEQTAAVLVAVERLLLQDRPDLLLVVGDVNSTLAATLAAAKLGLPVAHVEAGLRSFDRTMPEEVNRLATDALSDYLFTPSRDADENLRREGVAEEKIFCVGNVMIDTLLRCRHLAERSPALAEHGVPPKGYALLTLHRPSNVDDPAVLRRMLSALYPIQERLPVIFPIHPRTVRRIEEHGLDRVVGAMPRLRMVPPVGYLDFLALQAHAALVLTDSGGIQEETTVLGVPCLTLRENTERPITVAQGTNRVVGQDPERIVREAFRALDDGAAPVRVPDLWDGRAAERIADVLQAAAVRSLPR